MTLWQIVALLVTLTALFSYLNHRLLRLPTAIGVMALSLGFSALLVALSRLGVPLAEPAARALVRLDFGETLFHGMLSFLLFAGALHIDLSELARQKWAIGMLATAGVLLSTLVVGCGLYWILGSLGEPIPFIYCLLFGALISPTDPIAVLGILRRANVPKSVEIKIAGESLFNDGVGVVVFLVLLEIATGRAEPSVPHVLELLAREAAGGALIGLGLGWGAYRLLRSIDDYQVEALLTLALVMGGYELASALHASGPIAVVVSGLLIGNHGRLFAMSEKTREHLDTFWELIDEILNALLFVLIGLELLVISFGPGIWKASALAVPLVLAARWVSVSVPIAALRDRQEFSPGVVGIMTWGGLRGAISVALALSLPAGPHRDTLLAVTYGVVVFSVLAQGLTVGAVAARLGRARGPAPERGAD